MPSLRQGGQAGLALTLALALPLALAAGWATAGPTIAIAAATTAALHITRTINPSLPQTSCTVH